MAQTVKIEGTLVAGLGEAAGFTRLEWVRSAFRDAVGIDPWPGTVNLNPRGAADQAAWDAVRTGRGVRIPAPRPDWCDARCYRALIAGRFEAAIVVPEVPGYPDDRIELIAAIGVRDALGLVDGDVVAIEVIGG